jgi:ATP-binding protein involved in chromosome partitioning
MSHHIFGSSDVFRATAARLGVPVLGELPLAGGVSTGGDQGIPYALVESEEEGGRRWKAVMSEVAESVWNSMQRGP